jgi:hypothetical protein
MTFVPERSESGLAVKSSPPAEPANRPTPAIILGVVTLIGIASLVVTITDVHVPGRPLLAVASMCCLPGIPIAMALRIPSREVQLVLGIGLSLASVLLVAMVQLYVGPWSPMAAHAALIGAGLAATVVALARSPR